MRFTVIIPARYASTRFPGKPLALIDDKPMVQHVYERAIESGAHHVVVATDDVRIAQTVEDFGGHFCMTRPDHESGTERLAEVIQTLGIEEDAIVVNVQGDEPFIPPQNIRQVAENLAQADAPMATLSTPINDIEEVLNPNAVKVVANNHGYAMYFSRAPIPYDRNSFAHANPQLNSDHYFRHIGIYAYRAGFINRYIELASSPLEKLESLEQLRVLWHGEKIHVAPAVAPPPTGVDTPEDLQSLIQQRS